MNIIIYRNRQGGKIPGERSACNHWCPGEDISSLVKVVAARPMQLRKMKPNFTKYSPAAAPTLLGRSCLSAPSLDLGYAGSYPDAKVSDNTEGVIADWHKKPGDAVKRRYPR